MFCVNCACSLDAFEEHPFAKVQQMVRRSRLGQLLMLHASAYGLSAEFKTVPRGLMEMVDVL